MTVKNIRGKGRGVVADEEYAEGDIVEVCPVIVLDEREWKLVHRTTLNDYVFSWPVEGQSARLPMADWKGCCVCLGVGSLYNHASEANLSWKINRAKQQIIFYALRDIEAGEELTHDYSWPEDKYQALGVE